MTEQCHGYLHIWNLSTALHTHTHRSAEIIWLWICQLDVSKGEEEAGEETTCFCVSCPKIFMSLEYSISISACVFWDLPKQKANSYNKLHQTTWVLNSWIMEKGILKPDFPFAAAALHSCMWIQKGCVCVCVTYHFCHHVNRGDQKFL